jgi:hypothetical protein
MKQFKRFAKNAKMVNVEINVQNFSPSIQKPKNAWTAQKPQEFISIKITNVLKAYQLMQS